MSNILTKIERKKGLTYRVDKEGNVIEENYSWLKDPWTLVTLAILILGAFYYFQMKSSITNADNFGSLCLKYPEMIKYWEEHNPGIISNSSREIIKYYNTHNALGVSNG
jgi:hypothetical protein